MKAKFIFSFLVVAFVIFISPSVYSTVRDIDSFEYSTDADLNSAYTISSDGSSTLSIHSEATGVHEGSYATKFVYSLSGNNSWVKIRPNNTISDSDWSTNTEYSSISLWAKGYSGSVDNISFYIEESDGDKWVYRSNVILINDAWTKFIIPLAKLELASQGGDGNKALTNVVSYEIEIRDNTDDGQTPVNKTIYIDELRRNDCSNPIVHDIPCIENYVCYYGSGRVEDLAKFDLVIIMANNYTNEEIAQMQAGGTLVFGYLSVGEDVIRKENGNPITGDGRGPITVTREDNGTPSDPSDDYDVAKLSNGGYDSCYMDQIPLDGEPDYNEYYGGYYINCGNKNWQSAIIDYNADYPEFNAYYIINTKGCDGVFLDTVGIVRKGGNREWSAPGMVSLVAAMREAYPDEYIIANDAHTLDATFDLEEYVNAQMFESYCTGVRSFGPPIYVLLPDYDPPRWELHVKMRDHLNFVRNYPTNPSITVLSLDYCEPDDVICYERVYQEAALAGFVPSVAGLTLDSMYMVNPANKFKAFYEKDCPTGGIKLVWNSPEEHVFDSNVGHYVIKRSTAGPITESNWKYLPTVAAVDRQETSCFDESPLVDGEVYYGMKAKKAGNLALGLVGLVTTSIDYRIEQKMEMDGYFEDWSEVPLLYSDEAGDAGEGEIDFTDLRAISEDGNLYISYGVKDYITKVIDGNFSDWNGTPLIGSDIPGDAPGEIDWINLWACNRNGKLYISYETISPINLSWKYSIFLDTDNDATTGFIGLDGSYEIGAEYLIEGKALHQYTGDGTSWSWHKTFRDVDCESNGNLLEMAVRENDLNLSGDYIISIMLHAKNDTMPDFAKNDKSGFAYDTKWCLKFEREGDAWRYSVFLDTDNDVTTGFIGLDGSYGIGAEYLIEGMVLHRYTGPPEDRTVWSWEKIAVLDCAYVVGDRMEMRIPESELGLSGHYTIKILLHAKNTTKEDFVPDDKSGVEYPVIHLSLPLSLPSGWSMISLPVNPDNASVSSLFPDAVVVYGYEKGIGYVRVTPCEELEVGKGYWVLMDQATSYTITGHPIQSYTHPAFEKGWAMIGGCTDSARVIPDGCDIVVIYEYVPMTGYQRVTGDLERGKGYWILIKNAIPEATISVTVDSQGIQ